jgi:hypothetical protein
MSAHAATLTRHGLPQPPGEPVLALRYKSDYGDWYAQTTEGWFWWSGQEWKLCPMGPR